MPLPDTSLAPAGPEQPAIALQQASWALVSFLGQDATWCDWIYREFDGERIPKPLLGKTTKSGVSYPERLSVSPDPSDPQELELSEQALRAALHLILVVSPASGHSPALAEHLNAFRQLGRAEQTIALIVNGEPASPAAEPGSVKDETWLPDWLRERFRDNRFSEAAPGEPVIIDARLGIASLAEVRARVMATLLEVDRAELRELGIVTRPTAHLAEYPIRAQSAVVPPPTPSTMQFVTIAEAPQPRQQHSRWPIWVCGLAAIAALGQLAIWPAPLHGGGYTGVPPRVKTPRPPVLAPGDPLVEARPMASASELPQEKPGTATDSRPPISQPPAQTLPDALVQAAAPAAQSVLLPTIDRARHDLVARRDRLIRMAEGRMTQGDTVDALEILEHAIEVAEELKIHASGDPRTAVDLALLCRRTAILAQGLAQPDRARAHYDTGRQALLDLRSAGPLPKEAVQTLADLESSLKQLRNQ